MLSRRGADGDSQPHRLSQEEGQRGHGELGELLVEDGWNSGGEDQAQGHKQGPGPESKCCRM